MMKLSLHVSPSRTSFSTKEGTLSARVDERCDLIAELLRAEGADVEIVEAPVGTITADFSLVFAADLTWHFAAGGKPRDQLVVLRADRDQILEIAEANRVAAAMFYIGVEALQRTSNGRLVVRRDIAGKLGGRLGPGAPYFRDSEHYASWTDSQYTSLIALLVAYLNACLPGAPVVVSSSEAAAKGMSRITIRVDAKAAGMGARLFSAKHLFVVLSGPPGAPIAVNVWDCGDAPLDTEAAIRSRFVPPWGRQLEMLSADRGYLLGRDQSGMTFSTGTGPARIAWFGVLAKRAGGTVLVTLGAPGYDGAPFSASDVLSNPLIAKAVRTLEIE